MEILDLKKYYGSVKENSYVDPSKINEILFDNLKMNFDEIKEFLNQAKVTITGEEIKNYLSRQLELSHPDLKDKVRNYAYLKKHCTTDSKMEFEHFCDSLILSGYEYDKKELLFFMDYVKTVKNRTIKMLNIIEALLNGNTNDEKIVEVFKNIDLDVKDGLIRCDDLIRLLTPFIFNISDLKQTILVANKCQTYLNVKQAINGLNLDSGSYFEYGSSEELQIHNRLFNCLPGYIELSNSQKENLAIEDEKRYHKILKFIDNLE